MLKQLSVEGENKPGLVARISTTLGRLGINIESISVDSFGDRSIVRILTKDPASARAALERVGFKVSEEKVLLIKLLDRPGELAKVSTHLAQEGVNIENIFLITKNDTEAFYALRVDNQRKASKILSRYISDYY